MQTSATHVAGGDLPHKPHTSSSTTRDAKQRNIVERQKKVLLKDRDPLAKFNPRGNPTTGRSMIDDHLPNIENRAENANANEESANLHQRDEKFSIWQTAASAARTAKGYILSFSRTNTPKMQGNTTHIAGGDLPQEPHTSSSTTRDAIQSNYEELIDTVKRQKMVLLKDRETLTKFDPRGNPTTGRSVNDDQGPSTAKAITSGGNDNLHQRGADNNERSDW